MFMRIGYGKEISQKDAMLEKHYVGTKGVNMLIVGYHYSYTMNAKGAMQEAKACLGMADRKDFDLL